MKSIPSIRLANNFKGEIKLFTDSVLFHGNIQESSAGLLDGLICITSRAKQEVKEIKLTLKGMMNSGHGIMEKKHMFYHTEVIVVSNSLLNEGSNNIYFEHLVPNDLPPSLSSKYANVWYYLSLSISSSYGLEAFKTKRNVKIERYLHPLNPILYKSIDYFKDIKSIATLKVTGENTVLNPLEVLKLKTELTIKNHEYKCKSISFFVIQDVDYRKSFKANSYKHSSCILSYYRRQFDDPMPNHIPPKHKCVFPIDMPIKQNDTLKDVKCFPSTLEKSLITINHYIKFIVLLGSDDNVQSRYVIGTIPITIIDTFREETVPPPYTPMDVGYSNIPSYSPPLYQFT